MSLNRVSFGKVVDIYYRYNKNDGNGYDKAYNKCRKDYVALGQSEIIESEILDNIKTNNNEYAKLFLNLGNRIITEDDAVVYNHLKNIVGEQVAKDYADKHAETFIVDV